MSQSVASKAETPVLNTHAKTRSDSGGKKQRREFVFTPDDTLGMLRTAIRHMAQAGVKVTLINGSDGVLVLRIPGAEAVTVDGVTRLTMKAASAAEQG